MKRRDFIKATAGALAFGVAGPRIELLASETAPTQQKLRWYKGNIHCHSQWSDGLDLPEVADWKWEK